MLALLISFYVLSVLGVFLWLWLSSTVFAAAKPLEEVLALAVFWPLALALLVAQGGWRLFWRWVDSL